MTTYWQHRWMAKSLNYKVAYHSGMNLYTLISLINVEPTLTNFEKFHPPQKKIPPPRLLISLLKCLILLQNLMTIFLTIILSYKTLFYHKNWCLLPPPHLVIFHFWHPSTFIPGSTFIREMRVVQKVWDGGNKSSCLSYWVFNLGILRRSLKFNLSSFWNSLFEMFQNRILCFQGLISCTFITLQ